MASECATSGGTTNSSGLSAHEYIGSAGRLPWLTLPPRRCRETIHGVEQSVEVNRLGKVSRDPGGAHGGHHDDGNARQLVVGLELLQHFPTAHHGHHEVEQNQIRVGRSVQLLKRLGPVLGAYDVVPFVSEHFCNDLPNGFVVVGNQYADSESHWVRKRPSPASSARPCVEQTLLWSRRRRPKGGWRDHRRSRGNQEQGIPRRYDARGRAQSGVARSYRGRRARRR